jgi:hypothetical protein
MFGYRTCIRTCEMSARSFEAGLSMRQCQNSAAALRWGRFLWANKGHPPEQNSHWEPFCDLLIYGLVCPYRVHTQPRRPWRGPLALGPSYPGGEYGTRNSTLAAGCAYSHHHLAVAVLRPLSRRPQLGAVSLKGRAAKLTSDASLRFSLLKHVLDSQGAYFTVC